MEINNTFVPDLPYEKLKLIGISKEAADNLPQDVRHALITGGMTPLLEVDIKTANGYKVSLPVKLQVVEGQNGDLLVAYPVHRNLEVENGIKNNITAFDRERLVKGEILRREQENNGRRVNMFYQLDPETNLILRRPIAEVKIEQRIKDFEKINDIELGQQQREAAREGRPVELTVGGEKVTVGVDLKEPQGFKVIKGDMKEWDRQQQMKYDVAHPEYVGLVKTEQNRWEYKQIVDKQSVDRAIKIDNTHHKSSGIKL